MTFPPGSFRDEWYDLDLLPVPPQFGATFAAVFLQVLSWHPDRVRELQAAFNTALDDNIAAFEAALDRLDDQLTAADLVERPSRDAAGPITTIVPWLDRCMSVLRGAGYVLQAAVARTRGIVDDADFATITTWWVDAGLRLPSNETVHCG